MALYDQHLHSWFSMDSEADPAEVVQRAVSMGLAGLTFTDHFDTHPAEWPACEYDYEKQAEQIGCLREQFDGRIFIGHGIEVCYQPSQMDRILGYLDGLDFDMVLLSVHWFDGRALHIREHWEGLDATAGTRTYLETVLEAVRFMLELKRQGCQPFDVLGHLDLVKRYTQRYFQTYDIRAHSDLVEEILKTCIAADIVPEVNLSSWRQSLPEPMPAEWAIQRYVELGGKAMVLGSDAHIPEDVGSGIAEGMEILKRHGMRRLAVFKGRRRCDERL